MLKIAIIEDEQESRDLLYAHCSRYMEEHQTHFSVSCFCNGLDFLHEEGSWDILFLDIRMPVMNGVEVAKVLRRMDDLTSIIFVTSMPQFAIDGYSVRAMNYLLKPVAYETFSSAMRDAIRYQGKHKDVYCAVQTKDGLIKIRLSDLYYVEVRGHHAFYHTVSQVLQSTSTLKEIESKLQNQSFARCHASFLVNLEHVTRVNENTLMVHNEELPISRGKRKEFMNCFTNYLGGSLR